MNTKASKVSKPESDLIMKTASEVIEVMARNAAVFEALKSKVHLPVVTISYLISGLLELEMDEGGKEEVIRLANYLKNIIDTTVESLESGGVADD